MYSQVKNSITHLKLIHTFLRSTSELLCLNILFAVFVNYHFGRATNFSVVHRWCLSHKRVTLSLFIFVKEFLITGWSYHDFLSCPTEIFTLQDTLYQQRPVCHCQIKFWKIVTTEQTFQFLSMFCYSRMENDIENFVFSI